MPGPDDPIDDGADSDGGVDPSNNPFDPANPMWRSAPEASAPEPTEASGPVYRLPFVFGRYTLVKRLGVGGMAEAFLAQTDGPAGFRKTSVVKRMLPHLAADARFVQLFQREAKLAARLTHTNVVQIYELGEIEGIHFIAMEYVDGAPLHQLARTAWRLGKSVPLEVVCCAMADAALGLAAAHELKDADGNLLGVVHRDISPDNLMMNREGVTKVLDFGIAKHNGAGERTATGELKGKIPFMPPEQLIGSALDGRADLYSLGVTFYWLVTGQRPFQSAGDMQLMDLICKATPPPPTTLNPMLPPFINDLIMRLLEKDPARRPQTGTELHDLLLDALQARRNVVVPFIAEMLAVPHAADGDVPHTPSFASTPMTELVRSAWLRRNKRGAPASQAALPTTTTPASTPASLTPASLTPARRRAAIGIAAALLLVGVVAAVILGDDGDQTASLPVIPVVPVVAVAPQVAPHVAPHVAPEEAPETPAAPPVVEQPLIEQQPPAVVPMTAVQGRAPAGIQWLGDGSKVLGTGATQLKVPVGTKQIVALDKKRGGRSIVPIKGNIADYGALPRAKVHPRANPYADVYLGSEKLGTTPFAPVEVVVGKYTLRFVKGKSEQKRTVDVKPGDIVRVIVDFTGK